MYLNKTQMRTLKKLSKKPLVHTEKKYDPVVEYLVELDLVQFTEVNKPGDYMYHAWITEHGKAYLYDHALTAAKSTTAILVSIVSAIFSMAALGISLLSSLDDILENWSILVSSFFP